MRMARCSRLDEYREFRTKRLRAARIATLGGMAGAVALIGACAVWGQAQAVLPSPTGAPAADPALVRRPAGDRSIGEAIRLIVPSGTPIEVALDKEVRIERVGQPIRGHVIEPVYAFDKLVIPTGTEVTGEISQIESVPNAGRALAALDADFTPARKIRIKFSGLALPDGKHMPIETSVTPGSEQVIEFVSPADAKNQKGRVKDAASEKAKQARREAKQEWVKAMKLVEQPGKVHRIERYALGELPVHPQYIDAGTMYFVELHQPLDFGSEPLTQELASSIGRMAPAGSVVHARLVTPLDSATSEKGEGVEAVVTRPLFEEDRLILPQGSRVKGSVVQVQPARHMSHNGQLRFAFHELVLPDGVDEQVNAVLEGVQASKAQNLKLDSEGGAQATTPKTRYLTTAVSLGMAAVSLGGDGDSKIPNPAGKTSNRIVGGAGGFKLVGLVLGAFVKSRAFGYSMGAYGAGMSVYAHFIARGRDVVFPKNTAMDIGIGTRAGERPPFSSEKPAERTPADE